MDEWKQNKIVDRFLNAENDSSWNFEDLISFFQKQYVSSFNKDSVSSFELPIPLKVFYIKCQLQLELLEKN